METGLRSLRVGFVNGLTLDKVTADWPEITDREKLKQWVDGEGNMLVLCESSCQHTGPCDLVSRLAAQRYQDQFTFIVQPTVRAHTLLFRGPLPG